MTAKQFVEHRCGKAPELFKNKDDLSRILSDSDAREASMERPSAAAAWGVIPAT